jgi:hypothetical protein
MAIGGSQRTPVWGDVNPSEHPRADLAGLRAV